MIDFVINDGGRKEAGYKGTTGDCVVRAYCIITGTDYATAHDLFYDRTMEWLSKANTRQQRAAVKKLKGQTGKGAVVGGKMGVWPEVSQRIFKAAGLVKAKGARNPDGTWLTYSEAHEQYGNCIVHSSHHMAALKDGALQDLWDGRTYEWEDTPLADEGIYDVVKVVTKERKAGSIWYYPGTPVAPRADGRVGGLFAESTFVYGGPTRGRAGRPSANDLTACGRWPHARTGGSLTLLTPEPVAPRADGRVGGPTHGWAGHGTARYSIA